MFPEIAVNLGKKWIFLKYLPAEASANQDILQECLQGLNIGPETGRLILSSSLLQCEQKHDSIRGTFLETVSQFLSNFSTEGNAGFEPPPEQQQLQNPVVIGGQPLPGQQQHPVMFEGAVSEAGLPEQPAHPMEGAVGGDYDGELADRFLLTMTKTSEDNFSKLTDGEFTQTLKNDSFNMEYLQ